MVRKPSIKKHLTAFAEHNTANPEQKKSVHLTYHKLNGRTVKRKIDPLSIKNEVVVAWDHKRQALRSFKMERIKHMEKNAFWDGFGKQANHLAEVAGLGTLAAPSIQALRGKPMKEHNAHKVELAGLGILAAPSIAHGIKTMASRFKK